VPGHPAGDRVDGVGHVHAAGFQQVGQFADLVLGLRGGQSVAGHDDDLAGVGELDRGVVGRHGPHPRFARSAGARGGGVTGAVATGDDVRDRTVHRVGHELGEDRTGRPDQRTGDDERSVADHESGHRHRDAGAGVEQRDDHGRVGTADRQHRGDAECQRGEDDPDEDGHARAARDEVAATGHDQQAQRRVQHPDPPEHQRPPGHEPL
jgi:hypothetical protein